jgi:Methyltransferase domain
MMTHFTYGGFSPKNFFMNLMFPENEQPLAQDVQQLSQLLLDGLQPHWEAARQQCRILNLACGRCDEAPALIQVADQLTQTSGQVEMIGADIRIREIRQAREAHGHLPAHFLIQDATRLDPELGQDFDLVFLRHQNFWNGRELWKQIFDQGLGRLRPDGKLVITSYFDVEHALALKALQAMGMEVLSNRRNPKSRALTDAPGKSVDRWVAVLRMKKVG